MDWLLYPLKSSIVIVDDNISNGDAQEHDA